MITRRTLAVGTGALATGIALGAFLPRPAVAIEVGISPRLAALADAWKETWAAYHKVIGHAFATAQSNERPASHRISKHRPSGSNQHRRALPPRCACWTSRRKHARTSFSSIT